MSALLRLTDLALGATATIVSLPPGQPRLREMGVLPGTVIKLVRRAPLGDPLEISVRGSLLSLRATEAQLIEVTAA
jgi:ferrous iron transport protein A